MKNLLPTTKTIKRLGSGVVTPPNSFGAGVCNKRARAFPESPPVARSWRRVGWRLGDCVEALAYGFIGLDNRLWMRGAK